MTEKISPAEQIACLKREIALRKNVYPKWVASKRMTQAKADSEIAAMTAALQTILSVTPTLVPTHRHWKGGLYRVVAQGIEATNFEGSKPVTIYRNVDGDWFCRERGEFDDRFSQIQPQTDAGGS